MKAGMRTSTLTVQLIVLAGGPACSGAMHARGPASPAAIDEQPQEHKMSNQSDNPPLARRVSHTLVTHGVARQDPYYWLRDDERNDPQVLAYLKAEADYAAAQLAPLEDSRKQLYDEIVARIPKDDSSVPVYVDGYWYYTRVEEGSEYSVHCRRQGSLQADEQVFFDENVQAEGHAFYASGAVRVTVDGKTLAYAEDTLSRRIYAVRFRDLETGQDRAEVLEGTSGSLVWALDHRTLFYVKRDPETLRAHQVWRHALGTSQAEDVLVYDAPMPSRSKARIGSS